MQSEAEMYVGIVEKLGAELTALRGQSDSGPVDEAWLRSVGFKSYYMDSLQMVRLGQIGVYWQTNNWWMGPYKIPTPATRSDVRTLCRLLGCPLEELEERGKEQA